MNDTILIVTGSRDADEEECRTAILDFCHYDARHGYRGMWHGGCPTGADSAAAEIIADSSVLKGRVFVADWERFGKSAGPFRNRSMMAAARAELGGNAVVLAMPARNATNAGTRNAINAALEYELPVTVQWVSRK